VNDHVLSVPITQTNWTEIKLGATPLASGPNHLKWTVKHGTADLDWIDVTEDAAKAAN